MSPQKNSYLLLLMTAFLTSWLSSVATAQSIELCDQLKDPAFYESDRMDGYKFLVPGKEGWVFRTSTDGKEDFSIDSYGLQNFRVFSDILSERGTELVIALVPSRTLVAPHRIDLMQQSFREFSPQKALESYRSFIASMQNAGIHTAGVTDFSPYRDTFFYRLDQHWRITGAKATADAIAAIVKKLPVYKELKKEHFETQILREVPYTGTFARRIEETCGTQLKPETAYDTQTTIKDALESEEGLFGQQPLPDVVLIGTSNSTHEPSYANFEGMLKESLGVDVYNASISGGGVDAALQAYLVSDEYKKHPPKILIWEFPAYYNFKKGSDLSDQFAEFIATAYGECPIQRQLKNQTISGLSKGTTPLFSDLGIDLTSEDGYYLTLNFNKPIKKKFSIGMTYEDGQKKTYKFSRQKTFPHDGKFFLSLGGKESTMTAIDITPHEDMVGLSVDAVLCKTPKAQD